MKLSSETMQTMRSPVAKIAVLLGGTAILVLALQLFERLIK